MKSWILLLLLLSQNVFAFALTDFRIAQTEIKYIYDGDTFFITCRPELRCIKGKLGIRPPNVDTPEIKGKCIAEKKLAKRAKQHTMALLRHGKVITLHVNPKRP